MNSHVNNHLIRRNGHWLQFLVLSKLQAFSVRSKVHLKFHSRLPLKMFTNIHSSMLLIEIRELVYVRLSPQAWVFVSGRLFSVSETLSSLPRNVDDKTLSPWIPTPRRPDFLHLLDPTRVVLASQLKVHLYDFPQNH